MKNGILRHLWIPVAVLGGIVIFSLMGETNMAQENGKGFNKAEETKKVEQAINNVIGWAVNKDFDLFFNTISDDSDFISVTPYKRVKFGVEEVKKDTSFWGSPNFKAIRHELHDLNIRFSESGDVAWYYCILDDINTWKGEPANWEGVRWTGVLEKRNGQWRVVMQHYSWPKEN
jgi:ketosteroid isomerase-like protein